MKYLTCAQKPIDSLFIARTELKKTEKPLNLSREGGLVDRMQFMAIIIINSLFSDGPAAGKEFDSFRLLK